MTDLRSFAWLDDAHFACWHPCDVLLKGDDAPQLELNGIASTEIVDSDGETLIQKGMDWSDALGPFGGLTLEHPAGKFNTIGDIHDVRLGTANGVPVTFMRAGLWKGHRVGSRIAEQLEGMAKSQAKARWGFSIEGTATERDAANPKRVTRSKITSVALTSRPKNKLCLVDPIVKGLIDEAPRMVATDGDVAQLRARIAELTREVNDFRRLTKGASKRDIALLPMLIADPTMTTDEARQRLQFHLQRTAA